MPSIKFITHQQKLKTFSAQKVTKSSVKSSEQDKKKVAMCLKKRLQAIADGQVGGNSAQQYLDNHIKEQRAQHEISLKPGIQL